MGDVVCKGCGKTIEGAYITALGAMWHPEHFKCVRCGSPLKGSYRSDRDGKPFCPDAPQLHKLCRFCGRLVGERQSPGDERCGVCRADAVETSVKAQPLFVAVVKWAINKGMSFENNVRIHVQLADPGQLTRDDDDDDPAPWGKAYSRSSMIDGKVVRSGNDRIMIQRGLPTSLFQGVAVHELGHAWLSIHLVNELPKWAEEGFCQLIAHRWHGEQRTADSEYWAKEIEQWSSPIYGEGFRQLHTLAQQMGFQVLVDSIRVNKELPSL